jgi:hypothetical protein
MTKPADPTKSRSVSNAILRSAASFSGVSRLYRLNPLPIHTQSPHTRGGKDFTCLENLAVQRRRWSDTQMPLTLRQ